MARLLAQRVAEHPRRRRCPRRPRCNSVFARVPAESIVPLQEWSFFWEWDLSVSLVRWMTSFATTEDDVERFAAGVGQLLS